MRIGILGGGQLGRMLALAGYPLGLEFAFYDPDKTCCSRELAPTTHADFNDLNSLLKFSDQVDLLTYENENLPVEILQHLTKTIHPNLKAIEICQDRLLEKSFVNDLGIPTAAFVAVDCVDDLKEAAKQLSFPFILKTRRHGYDGKGQYRIKDPQDFLQFTNEALSKGCIAEQFVPFDREFSIIAVRNQQGETVFYDLCENIHRDGILIQTTNKINDPLFEKATQAVLKIAENFNYVGTLAVEFFQINNQYLVNEMAPRVHNSGHWTIEGAYTSQFENHLRAISGLPLGNPSSRFQILMQNIIGEIPDKATILQKQKTHFHDYGKSARSGRKLGHLTTII